MFASVCRAVSGVCALLLLQAITLQDAHASPVSFHLSDDIIVSFDKAGSFIEDYGYETESGSYYSQYFGFLAEGEGEVRVAIDFNGYIPPGKSIALNLGGSVLPTIYPDEFKWVFSEPRANIVIAGAEEGTFLPDGVSISLMPSPSQIVLILKVENYVSGKYKACLDGNHPFCETYSGEDLGLLHIGIGYSVSPVDEPGIIWLVLAGGVCCGRLAACRRNRDCSTLDNEKFG